MSKLDVNQAILKAISHQKKGEAAQAQAIYLLILQKFPNNARARAGMQTLLQSQHPETSEGNPPQSLIDGLILLYTQKQFGNLLQATQPLLAAFPASSFLWNIIGAANRELGQLEPALAAYLRALEIKPTYAEAQYNLGIVYKDMCRFDAALAAYQHALQLAPDNGYAYHNIGVVLEQQNRFAEAIAAYKSAVAILPNYANAYFNMGNALKSIGLIEDAHDAYTTALTLNPAYAEAENNLGMILNLQGKSDEAIAAYYRALAIKPDYADAYVNLGHVLEDLKELDAAYEAYKQALILDPSAAEAENQMLHQLRNICNWDKFEERTASCPNLGVKTERVATMPMLAAEDCPERQLIRAQKWAIGEYKRQAKPFAKTYYSHKRLRIGYFSEDFRDHPVLQLVSGLLREHDKSRFEIFAYSYSPPSSDDLRAQLQNDVEHFVDVFHLSDQKIVDHAREAELDIAIDLAGYTGRARSHIFQARLAPIQINYLGYPGSMGANFIDYIIGDQYIIPSEKRCFYTEKLIYLPHSYLPNDNQREISKNLISRAAYGLPEDSFVMCCFNTNYKITPAEFDIWMRLLTKINGSVLWLREGNRWSKQNLRYEAEQRGIDPARLIFAGRIDHADHLARYRLADLFVDTFHYNAHTTGSEALWAGLPVVTKQGKQFAARVGASLLQAIGLPGLITSTEAEYEALIYELAMDQERLKSIRDHIRDHRETCPLFDTMRYTRNFERGLTMAAERHQQAMPPEDIWVTEQS